MSDPSVEPRAARTGVLSSLPFSRSRSSGTHRRRGLASVPVTRDSWTVPEAESHVSDATHRTSTRCRKIFRRRSRACPCGAACSARASRSDCRIRPSASSDRCPLIRTPLRRAARRTSLFDVARPGRDEQVVHPRPSTLAGRPSTDGTSAATTSSTPPRTPRRVATEQDVGRLAGGCRAPPRRGPARSSRPPAPAGRSAARARPRARPACASISSSGRIESIFRYVATIVVVASAPRTGGTGTATCAPGRATRRRSGLAELRAVAA